MLRYFLIIWIAFFALSSDLRADDTADITAYHNIVEHDARLANIGYRLSTANAGFCPHTLPNMGWVLHDIAQYPDADFARKAFDFESPISILHVVENAPAYLAGVRAGDGFIGISSGDMITTDPLQAFGKSNDYSRMADVMANINTVLQQFSMLKSDKPLTITIIRDGEILTLPFKINLICATDYILDINDKIDAGANGNHVRITLGLSIFTPDDDELAAAVAHELAHNILQHRIRLGQAREGKGPLAGLGENKRVRFIEEEADRLSVWLMANAGFDVRDAAIFHQRLGSRKGRPIFGSRTHNKWRKRVGFINEEIAALALVSPNDAGLRKPPIIDKVLQNQ